MEIQTRMIFTFLRRPRPCSLFLFDLGHALLADLNVIRGLIEIETRLESEVLELNWEQI